MKGSYEEVFKMMNEMLKKDLVLRIVKEKNQLLHEDEKQKMNTVINQMNRMNCNKRVRDKEIKNTQGRLRHPNTNDRIDTTKIFRIMFFNHYGMIYKY